MQVLLDIFNWIISASITGSILALLILSVKCMLNKKMDAHLHYYIWILLIIRMIIPYVPQSSLSIFNFIKPITSHNYSSLASKYSTPGKIIADKGGQSITDLKNPLPHKSISSNQNESIDIKGTKVPSKTVSHSTGLNIGRIIYMVAMWIYLSVLILFLSYSAYHNIRFGIKIKKNCKKADNHISIVINECKAIMKMTSDIPVLITDEVKSPALFGVIKPILLIPGNLTKNITDNELKFIILHELSHYKRKDNWINFVSIVLRGVHWFNPIIWYSLYKMHYDCEVACDASVLSCLNQKEHIEYGYTILHLMKFVSSHKVISGAIGIMSPSNKKITQRRIIMISNYRKTSVKGIILATTLFVTIGAIGLTNAKGVTAIAANSNTIKANVTANNFKVNNIKYTEKDIKISYPQIYNLSDKNKEKTINQLIKNDAFRFYNFYKTLNTKFSMELNPVLQLNNSKILSISYSGIGNTVESAHPSNLYLTTNIDIALAKKIGLKDLININQAFIKKFRAAKYIGPLELTKDVQSSVSNSLKDYTDKMLIDMFQKADTDKGEVFSYFTKDSLIINAPLIHALGDYGLFQIKYSDLPDAMKTKNPVWKNVLIK